VAIMPGVDYRQVSDGNSKLSMARYDVVCAHTLVGYALDGSAAHFSTRWDGHVYQWRDTKGQSAANLYGNPRVISVENEDHGSAFGNWNTADGRAVPAFTPQQCEAMARICAWAHQTHDIPLVLCPDSKPGSRGIGYHRQGCDSDNNYAGYAYTGRVPGGELWSSAKGKVCPGDRRITQLINTIIPRARVLAGLEEDDDVSVYDILPCKPDGTGETSVALEARWAAANFRTVNAGIKALTDLVAAKNGITADQVAQALAPLILPTLTEHIDKMDDAELHNIADAVADELGRRVSDQGV